MKINIKPNQLHATITVGGLLTDRSRQDLFNRIDSFGLSPRVIHALHGRGVRRLNDLLQLSPMQIRRIRNIGERSMQEIMTFVSKMGLTLKPDFESVYNRSLRENVEEHYAEEVTHG